LPAIPGLADTDVWHFQDDAVSGDIGIDTSDPTNPAVNQPTWKEEYYQYTLPYCGTTQGIDGPEGIDAYSKDLAFELWTNNDCFPSTHPDYLTWITVGKPACWCFVSQCHGDADGIVNPGSPKAGIPPHHVDGLDLGILALGWQKPDTDPQFSTFICADFDHIQNPGSPKAGIPAHRVDGLDLGILSTWWQNGSTPEDCP
jgi:hypothetical protein